MLAARGAEKAFNQLCGLKGVGEIVVFPVIAGQRESNAMAALGRVVRYIEGLRGQESWNVVKFVGGVPRQKVHLVVRRTNPNVRAV